MALDPMQAACNHTTMGHLFCHVLCPTQSLSKRVITVAFGCMLFIGGLFAIYSAISKYFSTSSTPKIDKNPETPSLPKISTKRAEIISPKNGDIAPMQFVGTSAYSNLRTFQPVNPEIATSATLYFDHIKALKKALKSHQNAWDQAEVLQAADDLMKIAYTVSCLTLQDLKPFIEQLIKDGYQTRTYAQTLTRPDSYQIRTSYYCTNVYHWIRAGIILDGDEVRYPEVSETYAQSFYKQGTRQNAWNQLYNDYCDRISSYVKEEDLRKEDPRLANWTVKDTEIKTFLGVPDKQPGHQTAFLEGLL